MPDSPWFDEEEQCWVGVDDHHYPHEWEAWYVGSMGMCGCGQPEQGHNFLRSLLFLFDRRTPPWIDAAAEAEKLVMQNPEAATEVLLHFLSNQGMLEHGRAVGGSSLTPKGIAYIESPKAADED